MYFTIEFFTHFFLHLNNFYDILIIFFYQFMKHCCNLYTFVTFKNYPLYYNMCWIFLSIFGNCNDNNLPLNFNGFGFGVNSLLMLTHDKLKLGSLCTSKKDKLNWFTGLGVTYKSWLYNNSWVMRSYFCQPCKLFNWFTGQ